MAASRSTEYLTPAAVAAELNVSPSAVYGLIWNGDLPAVNLATSGRTRKHGFWRIRRDSLDDFVAERTAGRPRPQPVSRNRRRGVMQIPNIVDS